MTSGLNYNLNWDPPWNPRGIQEGPQWNFYSFKPRCGSDLMRRGSVGLSRPKEARLRGAAPTSESAPETCASVYIKSITH